MAWRRHQGDSRANDDSALAKTCQHHAEQLALAIGRAGDNRSQRRCATARPGGSYPFPLSAQLDSWNRRFLHGVDQEPTLWSALRQKLSVEECPGCVCAVQRRRFPVGANPIRQPLQPEAIGAVMEVTKWLKPSISVSEIGGSQGFCCPGSGADRRTLHLPL